MREERRRKRRRKNTTDMLPKKLYNNSPLAPKESEERHLVRGKK